MSTYIILSRLSPEGMEDPSDIKELAKNVNQKIKEECPGIVWKESYAVKGSYDIVDIVECDDEAEVNRASMIIRSLGHSWTETLTTTPWHEFLDQF